MPSSKEEIFEIDGSIAGLDKNGKRFYNDPIKKFGGRYGKLG